MFVQNYSIPISGERYEISWACKLLITSSYYTRNTLARNRGELFGRVPLERVTHGRNVTACRREMLRNVYPAEFQIHLRNTNLWNTVTKWWWYISYPDPYSTRKGGGSVRRSFALLAAAATTPVTHPSQDSLRIESNVNFPLLESSNRSLINCYYFERFFLLLWLLWELIINEREGESFLLWLLIIKERESFSIGNRNSVSIYYYYWERFCSACLGGIEIHFTNVVLENFLTRNIF